MPRGKKPATEAFTKAIAEKLRIQKSARRTTNQKIGEATGISPSQVSNYLNGVKAPDIEELDRMCTFLGLRLVEDVISPADLLTIARKYEEGLTPQPPADILAGDDDLVTDCPSW